MSRRSLLCTFYLDDLYLGVAVQKVQEVLRYQAMTRVPLASQVIRGLINLRGQIVTAIDLRRRMNLPCLPGQQLPMNVIIGTATGPVSLLVDEIAEVMEVDEDELEVPPVTLQGAIREMVTGAYKLPSQLLLKLDPERATTLTPTERTLAN